MNNINDKNYIPLTPFKGWVLENFPFIEANFDAITNYELLCKIIEYLNKMSSQFNDIINNLDYLNNWFNNLDVQDEINNKLDEMVESGELQEIIAEYLNANALWCFDNIQAMKEAPNLINGSYAKTLGYNNKNDGGQGLYKIRTITNNDVVDEELIISLDDETLIAELIPTIIYPETIGAIVNGTIDNSTKINHLLSIGLNNNYKIGFLKQYYIGNSINLPFKYNIDFNNTKFIALNNNPLISCDRVDSNEQNCKISNLVIDCNNISTKGMYLNSCWRRTFENIIIKNLPTNSIAVHIDSGKGGGNLFNDIRGITLNNPSTFIKNQSDDNTFNNCDYQNFNIGFETTGFARIYNLHGYIDDSEIYDNSYFIKILGNGRIFADNLYPDTQKYAFYTESTQPQQFGNIYYNFNNSVIDNTTCTLFSTNTNTKWYRSYVNNLFLSIPATITPIIIEPMHSGLNDSIITINNINGTSYHKYNVPFKYLKLEIDASNFTTAGANDSVCILKGSCPNSVLGSNKLIASKNIYTNFDLISGYYPFIGYGGANHDVQYSGVVYVTDNKVYIMPNTNQNENFIFNIVIPINKTSNNT